jgi:hypothetical protein
MILDSEPRHPVGAVRYVTKALFSSGSGWMDAEPEIALIQPDIYMVNEDGDKPKKRVFYDRQGLEYIILNRTPAPGLPIRSSTDLRGF